MDCSHTILNSTHTVGTVKPSVSLIVECTDIPEKTKLGCGCNTGNCFCIDVGNTVSLIPNVLFPDYQDCKENTIDVELFINEEKQGETITITAPEDLEKFNLKFQEAGQYDLKVVVSNCCGTCFAEHTIIVGEPLAIKRLDCATYYIADFRNYSKEYTLKIEIQNIEGGTSEIYVFENYEGNKEQDYQFALPSDGIYKITYKILDEFGILINSTEFIVYEFCGLIACYNQLLQDNLNCKTEDCTKTKDSLTKISKFVTLSFAFFINAKIQYEDTYALFYYDESYLKHLKQNAKIIREINNICKNTITDCGCN